MNLDRLKQFARNRTLRVLAVLLIVLIAAPEASIALDLTILLDIVGAELFLFCFVVGLRVLPWRIVADHIVQFLCRLDPYFFIPRRLQIRQCPPIVVHVVPGFIAVSLVFALWLSAQAPVATVSAGH